MSFKSLFRPLFFFLVPALAAGFILAVFESGRQQFFNHHQYGLLLDTLTSSLTRWTVIAFLLTPAWIAVLSLGTAVHTFLQSPSLSLSFPPKKNGRSFLKRLSGLLFLLLSILLLVLLLLKAITLNLFLWLSLAGTVTVLVLMKSGASLRKRLNRVQNKINNYALLKKIALAGLVVVLLLNAVQAIRWQGIPSTRPNILILVVDALRADHLGRYGYTRDTSPEIDQFSEDALVYESCYSTSPWTKTSVGSLLTSLYPSQHGAFFFHNRLPDSRLTLAEVFKNNRYSTLAVQTNPTISDDYNFDQGFASFQVLPFERAEHVKKKLFAWLGKKRTPFFAYLHFMETHLPYDPPPEYYALFETDEGPFGISGNQDAFKTRLLNELGLSPKDKRYFINLYDGEIRYFDDQFRDIITYLKEKDLYESTIIVLTSDHGEEFWDHGGLEHGHTLYNEMLHIPLMIKPAGVRPGEEKNSPVQIVDIYPTLLHLAGLKCPDHIMGLDLLAKLKNEPRMLYFEGLVWGAESKGILRDGIKLIENTGVMDPRSLEYIEGFKKTHSVKDMNRFELFDLDADPEEKHNTVQTEKETAALLRSLLYRFKTAASSLGTDKQIKKTRRTQRDKTREDLRSLGYIK